MRPIYTFATVEEFWRVSSLTHSSFLLPKWTPIPGFLPVSQTLHVAIILDLICIWVGMRILMGAMISGQSSSVLSAPRITTSLAFVATLTRSTLLKPRMGCVRFVEKRWEWILLVILRYFCAYSQVGFCLSFITHVYLGFSKHFGRRGPTHGVKDVDGYSISSERKHPRRTSGSAYGSQEKQVWVQKASSGT